MVAGVRHGLFLSGILVEVGFPEANMPWFYGNREAIQSTSKVVFRGRTEHVDIAPKYTMEDIENEAVLVPSVASRRQFASISQGDS